MCFEVLGFDIILNSVGKPFLLEVNHSPSFNVDTNLDFYSKSWLIKDTLKLIGVSLEEK